MYAACRYSCYTHTYADAVIVDLAPNAIRYAEVVIQNLGLAQRQVRVQYLPERRRASVCECLE